MNSNVTLRPYDTSAVTNADWVASVILFMVVVFASLAFWYKVITLSWQVVVGAYNYFAK